MFGQYLWLGAEPTRVCNQAASGMTKGKYSHRVPSQFLSTVLIPSLLDSLSHHLTLELLAAAIWSEGLISQQDMTASCYSEITYTYGVMEAEKSPATWETRKRCYLPTAHGRMFQEIKHTRQMVSLIEMHWKNGAHRILNTLCVPMFLLYGHGKLD